MQHRLRLKPTQNSVWTFSLFLHHSAESHNKETKILRFSFKQLRVESQQLFKLFSRVIFQDNHSQGQRCGGGATHCWGGGGRGPRLPQLSFAFCRSHLKPSPGSARFPKLEASCDLHKGECSQENNRKHREMSRKEIEDMGS